ncbi:hypothetical protein, partial [Streptomyces albidochromogenes]|uniref:hypothetical protein n=1 Tax=Streptomyces albidochromogenes TaxID=329524 RepID=UPI001ABF485C
MIEPYALSGDAREFHCLPSTTQAQRCTLCGELRFYEPETGADRWPEHASYCPDASPAPTAAGESL